MLEAIERLGDLAVVLLRRAFVVVFLVMVLVATIAWLKAHPAQWQHWVDQAITTAGNGIGAGLSKLNDWIT